MSPLELREPFLLRTSDAIVAERVFHMDPWSLFDWGLGRLGLGLWCITSPFCRLLLGMPSVFKGVLLAWFMFLEFQNIIILLF